MDFNHEGLYILVGKKPVKCKNLLEWGRTLDTKTCRLARIESDGVRVSTVFLGLDHNWSGDGPPLLFETIIFGGPQDQQCWRYSTWDQAMKGHSYACKVAGLIKMIKPPKKASSENPKEPKKANK